jgi:hypothetical protein
MILNIVFIYNEGLKESNEVKFQLTLFMISNCWYILIVEENSMRGDVVSETILSNLILLGSRKSLLLWKALVEFQDQEYFDV